MTSEGKKERPHKSIFVSYSPDAGFLERKFVSDTIKEFKENNLAEDIWFDRDENNTNDPCWFSMRMEAAEKCKAAVIFLSDSYISSPVSMYEAKVLWERQQSDKKKSSLHVYEAIYSYSGSKAVPKWFEDLDIHSVVNLVDAEHMRLSLAEKTSVTIGALMDSLEQHAVIKRPPAPPNPSSSTFAKLYKMKKIGTWAVSDLQEWLFELGIKEFYRQSMAELMVDGFLLMSITDYDMVNYLGIDSRVVRRKVMNNILSILDLEQKDEKNWHLRVRLQRVKLNTVYIIYDPADVRLVHGLKQDIIRQNFQVLHHVKLGQSKEEFLQLNSSQLASSSLVLVLLTEASIKSPFFFQESLFADWLGKKLVIAMFKNAWQQLRPALKAVLGDCPAVDFESQLYTDGLDILQHLLKPPRSVPGVVMEQSYLTKMSEGVQPLVQLCGIKRYAPNNAVNSPPMPTVFISYQWDMQSKVENIQHVLRNNGITCWTDPTSQVGIGQNGRRGGSLQRGHSGVSVGSSLVHSDLLGDSLQGLVQQNMKVAVVVVACVTPKYLQSEHCTKDLLLADVLHKPVIPVLLQFCPWPPENPPSPIRKLLARCIPIDLSNDKLFRQNMPSLLDRIKKIVLPLAMRH